jgi:hypothetical protein
VNRFASALCICLAALGCGAAVSAAATAPGVSTGKASAIAQQTATLNGTVNPHGVPTAFYFQFGRTKSYGTRTPTGDAGTGTSGHPVSAALTGLQPHTTYHFRLVAFSTAGTTRGGDRTFKTLQVPTVLTISASPNPVVYGGTVAITGALTGPGVAGKTLALQGKPFPFTGPFQQVGNSVLTNALGAYEFIVAPTVTTQLRVLDQSKPSVTSAIAIQGVALATTLHVRRSHRHPGRFRFSGRVAPARVGNAVLIQRRKHKRWKTVRVALTRTGTATHSRFSRRLRLHRAGKFRAVVKTAGGDYADGVSRSVRVRKRALRLRVSG